MIDREQLMTWLHDFYGCDSLYFYEEANALIDKLIANGMTVNAQISTEDKLSKNNIDVEPVRHGRWIKSKSEKLYFGYGMEGYYDYPELCSVCHYDITENGCGVGNYCPSCGAKMDGGKES